MPARQNHCILVLATWGPLRSIGRIRPVTVTSITLVYTALSFTLQASGAITTWRTQSRPRALRLFSFSLQPRNRWTLEQCETVHAARLCTNASPMHFWYLGSHDPPR